jgi:phage shock protein PspC (stress-responsive transcriptional regulator)
LQTPPQTSKSGYTGFDVWVHRLTVLLFVFVCAVVGVLLVIIPWRPEWTDNRILLAYPGLRSFIANGFVRGVCSGLGMLDIWIGFWEAVHYHEGKQA